MFTVTFSIFDADPNASGSSPWPDHTDESIDIEALEDADEAVLYLLDLYATGVPRADGYVVGDVLHALIWDSEKTQIGHVTLTLTTEHLGTGGRV